MMNETRGGTAGGGKWHFIGIGGVGMSGIAKACLEMGKPVSGSDLAASVLTDRLAGLGADVHIGSHDPALVEDGLEAVVVSSAIRQDNPERLAALAKGIPVIHRGSCLARFMDQKKGVAIAGAHGKTTTSAMIAYLLEKSGYEPSYFVGAYVGNLDTNAKWGGGEYLVAEADESDGSFLELAPEIALVTNVEDDHLDFYGTADKIDDAFVAFINKVPETGKAILCLDDPGVRRLLPRISHDRIITYGLSPEADLRGGNLRYEGGEARAEVFWRGEPAGTLVLQVYGDHNLLNALGAIATGRECGLGFSAMEGILYGFRGAHRRLEFMGEESGVKVYDDYAHHPTEIKVTLKAAKWIGARRMLVLFQPHRYTRTRLLAEEFGKAFSDADELILLPVYSAGEDLIAGADAELIADKVKAHRGARPAVAESFEEALSMALGMLAPGDLALTLGAGNIRRLGEMLLEGLPDR
ncbi:MAG: UDP-N-acetylmuramate--L-alanine ligase [Clostridiales bacterium]|nr:UDP-N-acetylmuramate--L-alanine ligase [Clostridiales bacterium]